MCSVATSSAEIRHEMDQLTAKLSLHHPSTDSINNEQDRQQSQQEQCASNITLLSDCESTFYTRIDGENVATTQLSVSNSLQPTTSDHDRDSCHTGSAFCTSCSSESGDSTVEEKLGNRPPSSEPIAKTLTPGAELTLQDVSPETTTASSSTASGQSSSHPPRTVTNSTSYTTAIHPPGITSGPSCNGPADPVTLLPVAMSGVVSPTDNLPVGGGASCTRSSGCEQFGTFSLAQIKRRLSILSKEQLLELAAFGMDRYADFFAAGEALLDSDPASRRVMVRGLWYYTTDKTFKQYFSTFGELENAAVIRHPDGRSQGYGFLIYKEREAAQTVIAQRHLLDRRAVTAKLAADQYTEFSRDEEGFSISLERRKLFIRNICSQISQEMLEAEFSAYGPVEECAVIRTAAGATKGYGFVTFRDAASAQRAAQVPFRVIRGWVVFVAFSTGKVRAPGSHNNASKDNGVATQTDAALVTGSATLSAPGLSRMKPGFNAHHPGPSSSPRPPLPQRTANGQWEQNLHLNGYQRQERLFNDTGCSRNNVNNRAQNNGLQEFSPTTFDGSGRLNGIPIAELGTSYQPPLSESIIDNNGDTRIPTISSQEAATPVSGRQHIRNFKLGWQENNNSTQRLRFEEPTLTQYRMGNQDISSSSLHSALAKRRQPSSSRERSVHWNLAENPLVVSSSEEGHTPLSAGSSSGVNTLHRGPNAMLDVFDDHHQFSSEYPGSLLYNETRSNIYGFQPHSRSSWREPSLRPRRRTMITSLGQTVNEHIDDLCRLQNGKANIDDSPLRAINRELNASSFHPSLQSEINTIVPDSLHQLNGSHERSTTPDTRRYTLPSYHPFLLDENQENSYHSNAPELPTEEFLGLDLRPRPAQSRYMFRCNAGGDQLILPRKASDAMSNYPLFGDQDTFSTLKSIDLVNVYGDVNAVAQDYNNSGVVKADTVDIEDASLLDDAPADLPSLDFLTHLLSETRICPEDPGASLFNGLQNHV